MSDQPARALPPMPSRLTSLPLDHRGYPVPWFVTERTPDGRHDFVRIQAARADEAMKGRLCWVSGHPLGRNVAFVVGPMCIINRVSGDPPVIPEIADWSVQACPFLSRPLAKRPTERLEGHTTPGIMDPGNPGICAVWVTRDWQRTRDRLFRFGEPERVTWWHKGAPCDPATAARGFEKSARTLEEMAEAEGAEAMAAIARLKAHARQYLPTDETQTEEHT